jgi:hypothetical protein
MNNHDFIKFGVVEDTDDPLQAGRVRVRVFGVHIDNAGILPTDDLPWALVGQGTDSAAMSGIGKTPRLLPGSWVAGFYVDEHKQKFVVLCSISGLPTSQNNTAISSGTTSLGDIIANIPPLSAPALVNGIEQPYIGSLTQSQVNTVANLIASLDSTITVANATTELNANYTSIANGGALSADALPEKSAGILCAAHFVGTKNAISFVLNGVESLDSSGKYNTSYYYNQGYVSVSGVKTNELPTSKNLSIKATDRTNTNTDARKYDSGITTPAPERGFTDPSGTYPLVGLLGESDINRLAKGTNLSKTIVGEKESALIKNIAIANSSNTWSQSPIPYNAQYPYNQVTCSEAGHIIEIDDTPGSERLNFHHAAGTFVEIDHIGNKVERTKGIRTVIVEQDELVNIIGSGHINVGKDVSIYVGGNCNIEVLGNINQRVHGNYNLQVDGSFAISSKNVNFSTSTGVLLDGQIGSIGSIATPIVSGVTYSPTIRIPSPVTRMIQAQLNSEFVTSLTSLLYATAPASTIANTDTSSLIPVAGHTGLCGFGTLTKNQPLQLTTNYSLTQLCKGHSFPYGVGQWGITDAELACNLKQLAMNVIEPLRAEFSTKGFVITSCFREAGSSISKATLGPSQHELGQAVDINFTLYNGTSTTRQDYYNMAVMIKNLIPFDQMILEYSPTTTWIHISYKSTGNRYKLMTFYCDKSIDNGAGLVQLA